jgi:hypothetical protein
MHLPWHAHLTLLAATLPLAKPHSYEEFTARLTQLCVEVPQPRGGR